MKSAVLVGSWAAILGCVVAACGGANSSDLFASDGTTSGGTTSGGTSGASSGTSGASGTSGTSGTSGASGASGTSGTSGTGNPGCRPSVASDCPTAGTYCKVVGCAAAGGVCVPKPTTSPTAFVARCGCDNVTYWNETVAGSFGANVKSAGVCPAGTGVPCKTTAGGTCAEGRDCNADVVTQCGLPPSTTGVCWGLPQMCPADGANYRGCPGGGGTNKCLSYCEAVRNQRAFGKDAITCK